MREKENVDNFLRTRASFGLIIKTDLESIAEIKRFVAALPGVELIYQTTSISKLWIMEGDKP